MRKHLLTIALTLAFILLLTPFASAAFSAADYQIVLDNPMTWAEANNSVQGEWHLATITSQDEQSVIDYLLKEAGIAEGAQLWVGGYQLENQEKVGDGWMWINEGAFDYTHWKDGQPKDWDSDYVEDNQENFLAIYGTGYWNDGRATTALGYIMEKTSPTPIPGAAWLLGSGLIGLVGIRRRFA